MELLLDEYRSILRAQVDILAQFTRTRTHKQVGMGTLADQVVELTGRSEFHRQILDSDPDAISVIYDALYAKVEELQREDIDAWLAARKVLRTFEDAIDAMVHDPDPDYEADYQRLLNTTEVHGKALIQALQGAIRRIKSWSGSRIRIRPNVVGGSDGNWSTPIESFYVLVGDEHLGFSVFTTKGKPDQVEDVLEGGDLDFFRSPLETSDYFNLIKEIRKPGSSSQGKTLTLWTARPTKDRRLYERARTLPPNLFLTTDMNRASGIAHDLGASEVGEKGLGLRSWPKRGYAVHKETTD
jgi:hypothetical protein